MTQWSIVCPGPSMDWSVVPQVPERTIAVNLAIKDAPWIPGYWANLNKPGRIGSMCRDRVLESDPKPELLRFNAKPQHWQEWYDAGLERAVLTTQPEWLAAAIYGGRKLTAIYAAFWPFSHGCTELVYYGHDMGGTTYYTGKDEDAGPADNRGDVWWTKRWGEERPKYEAMVEAAARQGFIVRRHGYEDPDVVKKLQEERVER